MKIFLTILTVILLIVLAIIVGNLDNESGDKNSETVTENELSDEMYCEGDVTAQFELDNLSAMDTLTPGYVVKGSVPGNWFFEATAPYVVVNWDGLIIGEGFIQATGEWMTTDPVPFVGGVAYELDSSTGNTRGVIIFNKANASGLFENDQSVEIPVELMYTN